MCDRLETGSHGGLINLTRTFHCSVSASAPLAGVAAVGKSFLCIPGITVVKSTVLGCVACGILTASLVAFPVPEVDADISASSLVVALSPDTAGFKGLDVTSCPAIGYELVGDVEATSSAWAACVSTCGSGWG